MKSIPYLKDENGLTTLMVDGEPFVALAGEVHNSSSSSLAYMAEHVWPNLRGLHLNTVIAPIYWELIEPKNKNFDFELVDGLIAQARREGVRLVLLWFGLWKNGKSSYVPGWVKRDYKTYFRARYPEGLKSDTISPLCEAAVKADRHAFQKLMEHLKEIDGDQHTVIMMQVENEIGFLGSDRDYSDLANTLFVQGVPTKVSEAYGKTGTWNEVFGRDAAEFFMAYHYARAVEQIAKAGSEVYPLPMFVNAWLEQHPYRPGTYPSGGPIAKMMKMWKLAAPTICLYAPDIYLPNFAEICEEYTVDNNPLFIPEARRDVVSATNVFYAIGKHHALCFSPFGIEDFLASIDDGNRLDTHFDSSSGFVLNGTGPYLAQSYRLLGNMMGIINQYRGTNKMKGFLQNHDSGCILPFTKYDLKVNYRKIEAGKPISGGLVIEVSEDEFIFAGIGFSIEFLPKLGCQTKVDYIRIEEGTFVNNQWIRGRVLNGDEAYFGLSIGEYPSAICAEMYTYE